MIKWVFTDMDGTLLDDEGRVTPENAALIAQSQLPLTLVSARSPREMVEAIDVLQLTGPQIAFNGGMIFEPTATGKRILTETAMASDTAQAIIGAVLARFPSTSVSYYDGEDWYAERMDENIEGEIRVSRLHPTIKTYQEVFATGERHILKIMLINFDEAVMAKMLAFFAAADYPGVSAQHSGSAWLEITSQDAKKSRGIAYLMAKENLKREETAAFGDGGNDLPMLNMVGVPIVMGNAAPEIKQVGKYITKPNTENGVGYGMVTYLNQN